MAKESSIRSTGLTFVWCIYIGIFVLYLCYSYSFLFFSTFPSLRNNFSLVPAVVLVILIVRIIGETSKSIYGARRGVRWGWAVVPLTLIPAVLLTVLALLPTSIWAFLGPEVVSTDIHHVSERIETIKSGAESWLIVPDYEKMHAEVEKLSQSLDDEIHSVGGQNNCGVGAAAKETISKIHQYLPEIYVYPGTTKAHDCTKKAEVDKM